MSDFLSDFIENRKNKVDPETKFAVEGNKWDKRTQDRIEQQVREYVVAQERLSGKISSGGDAMSDSLLALYKAMPSLKGRESMRPSHIINHMVMGEMIGLESYQTARQNTVGDIVATGLSAAAMENTLEILFDKLKPLTEKSQALDDTLDQIEKFEGELEDLMKELEQQEEQEGEEQERNLEYEQQLIEQELQMLRDQAQREADDLEQEMTNAAGEVREQLDDALEDISKTNEALQAFSWGIEPGSLKRMDSKVRLALSQKLRTQKFHKLADLLGRMHNLAVSEITNMTDHAQTEVYSIELGDDLKRMIPSELLEFSHDVLFYNWFRKYVASSLSQYALRGQNNVVRGGIISLVDSSTSMEGNKQIWAKAVSLELLRLAKLRNRPFFAVDFSGAGNVITHDFDTRTNTIGLVTKYQKGTRIATGIEAVVQYAEAGLQGGTSFMTPLSLALDRLRAEHAEFGSVQGDIVLITDGDSNVDPKFMREFKAEQERLGFKVYGIVIGGSETKEPLRTICDGRVISLRRLTNPEDISDVFKGMM